MILDNSGSSAGVSERRDRILAELRSRGQRVTPQRVAILSTFLGRKDHPSADQVHRDLQAQYPMLALSTVYATLELLVEMGEASEVSPTVSEMRFDPTVDDHCHLVCLRCGRVVDVPSCEVHLDGAAMEYMRAEGFELVRQVQEFLGVCSDCRANAGE